MAVPAQPAQNNSVVRLISYIARPDTIDLLFSDTVPDLLEEPFGLRFGFQRVPFVARKMSGRWLRLSLGARLSPGAEYHLMLGPQLEFPLRWQAEDEPSAQPALSGAPRRRVLPRAIHRFAEPPPTALPHSSHHHYRSPESFELPRPPL